MKLILCAMLLVGFGCATANDNGVIAECDDTTPFCQDPGGGGGGGGTGGGGGGGGGANPTCGKTCAVDVDCASWSCYTCVKLHVGDVQGTCADGIASTGWAPEPPVDQH